jgi:hypothetical protein
LSGARDEHGVTDSARIVFHDLLEYLHSLDGIGDAELLTLKAHLVLEASLRRVLAVRLGATEDEIPRLSFPSLARLVAAGANPLAALPMERHALLLNQLRNDIAHRLSPRDQIARMREFTALVTPKRGWSDTAERQRVLYRNALKSLCMQMQLVGSVLQLTPEEETSLETLVAGGSSEGGAG